MTSTATLFERAEFIERRRCIACDSEQLQELASGTFDSGPLHEFLAADPWGEDPLPFLADLPWRYVACEDCGQAFQQNILNPEWNERRFSKWMSQEAIAAFEATIKTPARRFEQARQHTAHVLQLEKLTRSLRGSSPVRVLDFGCGYGNFLAMCAAYGFEAVGIDRSTAKRDHGLQGGVFAEIADLQATNPEPFHALTLFEVLEHLDDPHPLLEVLSEFLAPGGILVLETPDCSGVTDIRTHDDYLKIHPLEHINGFTPQTLKSFAESLGFESIKKPLSQVSVDPKRIAKTEIKRALAPVIGLSTQQYFRKR